MIARPVLVIGGGVAGVAAAAALQRRGARVTLLEARARLGGRARSDELHTVTIDVGAQLISSAFTRTRRLLETASPDETTTGRGGLPAALARVAPRDTYVNGAERHSLIAGSVRSLLTFGALGAGEKLALARELLPVVLRSARALDPAATRVPSTLDAESARAFVLRAAGEHAARITVEPPLNAFYAMRGDEASVAFFLMLGRAGSAGDLLAPAAGWSAALAGAARRVHVEAGGRVASLARAPGGGVRATTADGRMWDADAAVIATGPRTARTLLASLASEAPALMEWLGDVELRSTWTLALLVDATLPRETFGIFQDPLGAGAVSACALPGVLRNDHSAMGVVLAWPTPALVARAAIEPPDRIAAMMLPEIETLVPAVRGHVVRARVYRLDEGTPVVRPGFAADRAAAREMAARLVAPVALAGDYLSAPLLEGAVATGEAAASIIAQRLGLPSAEVVGGRAESII